MDGSNDIVRNDRLLVTGVDGVLGANFALSLADRADVLGLYATRPVRIDGLSTRAWDPRDESQAAALVHDFAPGAILHCGPLACGSWDTPEELPDGRSEARTCCLLARTAAQVGSRLVVLSTDAVFDGPRLFYTEDSAATGRGPLAEAARQVEQAIAGEDVLVVRTHAYGWSPRRAEPGFAEATWQALCEGTAAGFAPHRCATPILANDLAEFVWLAIRRRLSGVLHLAGAERVSQYRFAAELASAFGMRDCAIAAREGEQGGGTETSLDCRRACRALGRSMPALREGIERFASQAASGYRQGLRLGTLADAA